MGSAAELVFSAPRGTPDRLARRRAPASTPGFLRRLSKPRMQRVLRMNRPPPRMLVASVLLLLVSAPPARADLKSDIQATLADKLLQKGSVGVEIIRLGEKPADDET